MELLLKEDSSHPARFFLESQGDLIFEIGVVAGDYENWSVIWAQTGGKGEHAPEQRSDGFFKSVDTGGRRVVRINVIQSLTIARALRV